MLKVDSDNAGSDVAGAVIAVAVGAAVAVAAAGVAEDAGSRSIRRFDYYEALQSCGDRPPRSYRLFCWQQGWDESCSSQSSRQPQG